MLKETNKNKLKDKNSSKLKSYKGKISNSILRIFLLFTIFLILIGFTVGLILYRITLLELDSKNIKAIDKYINVLKKETKEAANNFTIAKKYSKKWYKLPNSQKNLEGIALGKISEVIENLSKKHMIFSYDFNMSVPELVEEKDKLNFYSTICRISFKAIDDISFRNFINDLQNEIPGYIVINKLNASNSKIYTHEDLVQISKGREVGVANFSISFTWFAAKEKEATGSQDRDVGN